MERPTVKTIEYYDYFQCVKYLIQKYNIKENDHAYWYWLLKVYNIYNGIIISLCEEIKPDDSKLQIIHSAMLAEFGKADLMVSW